MVEAMGLEPTILLRATQALYQTELRPQGRQRYQRGFGPRMPHTPNTCLHHDVEV
jgi:hypothetical protein